jgi:hypothetical protein
MNIRLLAGQARRSEGFLSKDLVADIGLASLYAKSPMRSSRSEFVTTSRLVASVCPATQSLPCRFAESLP